MCTLYFSAEEEEEGRVGQRPDGLAGCWADWAKSRRKFHFVIKIGFLNIVRLWKFVQGDLGWILMWGFFSKFF
jgi:hypothetical protein